MIEMYSLYWIFYPEHTDILTEGYVGISSNIDERFKSHKNNRHNPRVSHALKKGAVLQIIEKDLTKQEACDRELELRPTPNIGWNLAEGGGLPPSQKGRTFVGRSRTKEQNEHHSKVMKGRVSPHKGKKGHTPGPKKVCYYRGMEFKSMTEAAKHFGVTVSAVSLYVKREGNCVRYNK